MTKYKITQLSLESDEGIQLNISIPNGAIVQSLDGIVALLSASPRTAATAPVTPDEPAEIRTGERGAPHEPWAWSPAYARERSDTDRHGMVPHRVHPEDQPDSMGGSPHPTTGPTVPQPSAPRRPPRRTTEDPSRIIPVGGNRSRHWSPEQEKYLLDQLQLGRSLDHIARYLDREPSALRQRIRVIANRKSTERVEPQPAPQQPNRSGFSLPPAYTAFNGGDVTRENAPTD